MTTARKLTLAVTVPVLLFALLQVVPYGRQHSNPPDGTLAAFDSPRTQELAQKACFDCHSNRTRWPWYASIAPMSWRIQSHVDEGRESLNFTALNTASEEGAEAAGEAGKTVTKGEMPPRDYLLLHPEARLSAAEKSDLARGL
ncbi:MAG TPA: heme-binding domain-containing protein [bacterium]